VIAGSFQDSRGQFHAYLLTAAHVFTTFNVPRSSATEAFGINAARDVTGVAVSAATGQQRGFERSPSGRFSIITVPRSKATIAVGINGLGRIVGTFEDRHNRMHGFLRS
jgi:hypothetical protein